MKKLLMTVAVLVTAAGATAQTLGDAIKLTDKEQFEKATGAFRKLVTAEPQNAEAWFYFGESYWENERADSAEACYRMGVGANPKYPLNKVGLGKVLWSQKLGSGIISQPMTYLGPDGRQYVAVYSGVGGAAMVSKDMPGFPPRGSTLYVFSIDGASPASGPAFIETQARSPSAKTEHSQTGP